MKVEFRIVQHGAQKKVEINISNKGTADKVTVNTYYHKDVELLEKWLKEEEATMKED